MTHVITDIETGSPILIPVGFTLPTLKLGDCVSIKDGSATRIVTVAKINIAVSGYTGSIVTDITYESMGGTEFKQEAIEKMITTNRGNL